MRIMYLKEKVLVIVFAPFIVTSLILMAPGALLLFAAFNLSTWIEERFL